ncbi:molybdate ABC transporter substrate-binding protein [Reichenbachiella sp. MALMAid0571]|uniref:molybdate ABC transporter substrate-binding protein n=1 Tax=Reichenbachiella sp. MALMAid0571 TaxID=3143939 RepID=UPI0032E05465
MKNILRNSYIMLIALLLACKGQGNKEAAEELTMYCAAGMKPAVEQIAKAYQKEYGVNVNLQYGGSGTLLSNILVANQGDLYLAADESYIQKAQEKGLLDETQPLAYLKPVIAVKANNPLKIKSLADLKNKDIKLAIANPEAASIGKVLKKILTQSGEWEEFKPFIEVMKPTVNEVANDVKIGTVDAGIIWDAVANQYPELEYIEVPEWQKYTQQVTFGVLKSTKNPTAALKFMRYLSARDKGLTTFSSLGYEPIEGDVWNEKPEILFYSGGVNRLAVDKTIQEFEKREGVEVVRVYNGCGILVSQIRSGQKPDAYLSCDVTFMDQVEDSFQEINNVSSTDIVIVTDIDNSKKIVDLESLTRSGLKLGVCNPKQSALGALTVNMLDKVGLTEDIMKNVVVQTPTADLLVNQLRTGALDAAIVYAANVAQVLDKVTVVKIERKEATATQNIGINTSSKYKYLTRRLYQKITSETSQQSYLANGFSWISPEKQLLQ